MSNPVPPSSGPLRIPGPVLFASGIFAGAFLIFLVQPLVAKRILPWFGGGPGVWTMCLMFYQSTLFFGYAYAHALVRFARPSAQLGIHTIALIVAFALLPVLPGEAWKPGPADDPSYSILVLLLAHVALPFMVLAATGPLLQAWFARRYPDRSPYALYAISNVGSLAALLAFPSVVEPFLPLDVTSSFWSAGFVVAGLLILVCGALALRPGVEVPSGGGVEVEEEADAVEWKVFALWLLLPACAVLLLMAVTNKLCLDVASLPFLWVLPLGLYLVTFILCFASERFYPRLLCIGAAALGLLTQYGVASFLASGQTGAPLFGSLPAQTFLFSLILFSLCMLMHGELYRLRPPASRLTFFYLAVSGGGALGGLFVGLVAPRIFSGYYELPLGFGLASILMLWALGRDPGNWLHVGGPRWRFTATATAAFLLLGYVTFETVKSGPFLLHQERSFFGVLRVMEVDSQEQGKDRRSLIHGTTLHGIQYLVGRERKRPTSYFGLATGIGVALSQRTPGKSLSVGVVGLGVGTLAAYGRTGDRFRFYEIDPAVIRIAGEGGYFSFISDSDAAVELIQGDARLSLQREMDEDGGHDFDVLIIDAFSSDSIPVHLITREVFDLYFKHLKLNGLLAVHVSNRYFDLRPIVYRIGIDRSVDMTTLSNASSGLRLGTPAKWIFLSRDEARLRGLRRFAQTRLTQLGLDPDSMTFGVPARAGYESVPLWTDDYSSLLALLGGANRVN